MHIKKRLFIFMFIFTAAVLSANVYAGKIGAPDDPPDFWGNERVDKRRQVGKSGHYLVGHFSDDITGYLIEDENGNDLFGYSKSYGSGSISIQILDEDAELYRVCFMPDINKTESSTYVYLNGEFKEFCKYEHIVHQYNDYNCVKFKDFCVAALGDPAHIDNCIYYDIDGNEIYDIRKYIKKRGASVSSGKYRVLKMSATEKNIGLPEIRVFGDTWYESEEAYKIAKFKTKTLEIFQPWQIITAFILILFMAMVIIKGIFKK